MKEEKKGLVFDVQRYTLNDGPGIRTEVFLQGCNLNCLWCHSPDSISKKGEIAFFPMGCIGLDACGMCLKACDQGAITPGETVYSKFEKKTIQLPEIDRSKCIKCKKCTEVCYPKALYHTCDEMSVLEVVELIKKDQRYFEDTSGGVTLSGGEPLVQADFAAAILKECKALNIHTAVDTSGYVSWRNYEKVLDYTDLFLYDLKSMFPKISKVLIGKPNQLIVDNLRRLAAAGKSIQVRYPMIPGLNTQKENMEKIAELCVELGPAVSLLQVLPYHKLGCTKYERIGKEYKIAHIPAMARETAEEYAEFFRGYGIKTMVG
ncbi:glycyl-radical enzyme activating protein [Vagococcus sp.]|uniref:glycyl-radical enzyme activating protein n=1 Tax=Vagococcus sp. TaxID=1933889 RepID=UPI003F9DC4CC